MLAPLCESCCGSTCDSTCGVWSVNTARPPLNPVSSADTTQCSWTVVIALLAERWHELSECARMVISRYTHCVKHTPVNLSCKFQWHCNKREVFSVKSELKEKVAFTLQMAPQMRHKRLFILVRFCRRNRDISLKKPPVCYANAETWITVWLGHG